MYCKEDKECIISINPDLILVPTWGSGKLDVNKIKADLENDPALQSIKAIRNKRLVQLPDMYLYCASQDIVEAISFAVQGRMEGNKKEFV
ncbi:MAG: corrinoid transporter substrate-binding protein [Firmicutes bacterium]|nr:corrinoid transporter substrate-binding protein [Bacillota bacterium]